MLNLLSLKSHALLICYANCQNVIFAVFQTRIEAARADTDNNNSPHTMATQAQVSFDFFC